MIIESSYLVLQAPDHLPVSPQHEPKRSDIVDKVMVDSKYNLHRQARKPNVLTGIAFFQFIHGEEEGIVSEGEDPAPYNHHESIPRCVDRFVFQRVHDGYEALQVDKYQAAHGTQNTGPHDILADVEAADEISEFALHRRGRGEEVGGHHHNAGQEVHYGQMDHEVTCARA